MATTPLDQPNPYARFAMNAGDPHHAREVAPGLRVHRRDDGVHHWWLWNEARRNAVSAGALQWIARHSVDLAGEIVILRGFGGKAFCSGFDLTTLSDSGVDPIVPDAPLPDACLIEATAAITLANATFIAAIEGYAIGAGAELACACDLRIAHHEVFFAVPAAELGVVYHADGLARIHQVLGPSGVRRLLLLGERLDAQHAWSAGALVRLVASDAIDATLSELIEQLQRAAPLALQGNRDLLRQLEHGPLSDQIRYRHEQRRRLAYTSHDHQEARLARAQRRTPNFRGH